MHAAAKLNRLSFFLRVIAKISSPAFQAKRPWSAVCLLEENNSPSFDSRSAVQCSQISDQLPYVWIAELFSERWHLAFDSRSNHLMNPVVASVQIMQIRAFVAVRILSMTMRAIHQKQMPALRGMAVNSADCAAA